MLSVQDNWAVCFLPLGKSHISLLLFTYFRHLTWRPWILSTWVRFAPKRVNYLRHSFYKTPPCYFPRRGLIPWTMTTNIWNKAPKCSLACMADTSGLQERKLVRGWPHYLFSLIVSTRITECPTHGGVLVRWRPVPRAFRDAFIFFFGLAWAKLYMASLCLKCVLLITPGPCFSKFVITLWKKLLESHVKIPTRPLVRDDWSIPL